MSSVATSNALEIIKVNDFTADPLVLSGAVGTYENAFGGPPYCERFDEGQVAAILGRLARGDLVLGVLNNKVVSLAGGYTKPNDLYYVEELAVGPDSQGQGVGRLTLNALLEIARKGDPKGYEIRTAVGNDRAISLYKSLGFEEGTGTVVVASTRSDGAIGLGERVYLYKPPLPEAEQLSKLRHAVVAYPSGNTTAVVFDQAQVQSDRQTLNGQVIDAWDAIRQSGDPGVEQCCFVTRPNDPRAVARAEMFGGEFCANAARSVVYLLSGGQDYQGVIEVSGARRPLEFSVRNGTVALEMPLPEAGTLVRSIGEGTLVQLDGITQVVVTEPRNGQSPRGLLAELLANTENGLADQPCVGVTYYNERSGQASFCVWIKEVNTIFDETACGSGTCAIGVALATRGEESIDLEVVQPSGELIATRAVYNDGRVIKSTIAGGVKVLYDGELQLS